jgi:hypothetical protein
VSRRKRSAASLRDSLQWQNEVTCRARKSHPDLQRDRRVSLEKVSALCSKGSGVGIPARRPAFFAREDKDENPAFQLAAILPFFAFLASRKISTLRALDPPEDSDSDRLHQSYAKQDQLVWNGRAGPGFSRKDQRRKRVSHFSQRKGRRKTAARRTDSRIPFFLERWIRGLWQLGHVMCIRAASRWWARNPVVAGGRRSCERTWGHGQRGTSLVPRW